MGLFSTNPAKQRQIDLQNIIFGTDEKKLMVSQDFLNDMAKNYVSKRMKNINKMSENIAATKSPRKFFNCYDSMINDLNELIKLEKEHLYVFKKPTPTEFKKLIKSKKDRYTENMINRAWKEANQRNYFQAGDKRDPVKYGPFLAEILEFQDRYSRVVLDLVDTFYISVYDESFRKPEIEELPPAPEPETVQQVIEAAEAETENLAAEAAEGAETVQPAADNGIMIQGMEENGDGFIPENFMQISE